MQTLTDPLRADLTAEIAHLADGARRWAARPLADRARLLRATHRSIAGAAERWVEAARTAKNGAPASEEWLSGPYAMLGNTMVLADSLDALAEGKSPAANLVAGSAPGGRTTLRVLPTSAQQRFLLHGFRADVWLQPGITAEQARSEAGLGARTGAGPGVALVLGAGNITSIGPLDVLYQLVAENRAGILKLNPTFDRLCEVYRAAMAPLVAADLVRIVTGDAAVGAYLAEHPGIAHIHLTGSARTHDAVVWGVGSEADRRRSSGRPRLAATVSSELGGVSPTIIVPGDWSAADLRYQAEHVVSQRLHNSGHNCVGTQLLILSADWPQRTAFLDQVRRVLDELHREPWYPGTADRLAEVDSSYPAGENHAGCRLVEIGPGTSDELFRVESFGPTLGHTTVSGSGTAFFRRAVAFANDRLAGNLGAGIVIAPADRRRLGAEFETTLAELHYGGIGVNVWSGFDFGWPTAAWGAYPGDTLAHIGSGIGVVHNGYLLAGTERTVVRGPFSPFPRSVLRGEWTLSPKPPWFLTSSSANETARRMVSYAARPSWHRLLSILPPAFRP